MALLVLPVATVAIPRLLVALGITAGTAIAARGALRVADQMRSTTYYNYSPPCPPPPRGGGRRDPPPPDDPPPPPDPVGEVLKAAAMAELVEELIKKALKEKDSEPPKKMMITCQASGPLTNQTHSNFLRLKGTHEWCGNFLSCPPSENKKGAPPQVVHKGAPPQGSKAGVVYADADGHDNQWLVAWHVPLRNHPNDQKNAKNKIYVEFGPEAPVDWNRIEKKLDASGNEYRKPGAVAKITDGPDAIIGVVFYE